MTPPPPPPHTLTIFKLQQKLKLWTNRRFLTKFSYYVCLCFYYIIMFVYVSTILLCLFMFLLYYYVCTFLCFYYIIMFVTFFPTDVLWERGCRHWNLHVLHNNHLSNDHTHLNSNLNLATWHKMSTTQGTDWWQYSISTSREHRQYIQGT